MSSILKIKFIILPVVLVATGFSVSVCLAKEKIKNAKTVSSHPQPQLENGEESITWTSSHSPLFQIKIPGCWLPTTDKSLTDSPETLTIKSSPKCPASDKGEWELTFTAADTPLTQREMLQPQYKMEINKIPVTFYFNISPIGKKENFGGKPQKVHWTGRFSCSGMYFAVGYDAGLNNDEVEKVKKEHVAPEVLKKFIQAFNCNKVQWPAPSSE